MESPQPTIVVAAGPTFLSGYKMQVLQFLDHLEAGSRPFMEALMKELRNNPRSVEVALTVLGIVALVGFLIKVLFFTREPRQASTGAQLTSLRAEVEKARNQLNTLRKLMQQRTSTGDRKAPASVVAVNTTMQKQKEVQLRFKKQLQEQKDLIARQAESLAASSKFNQSFLPKFQSVLLELVQVKKKIGKGTSKSSAKSSATKSAAFDISGLSSIHPNPRQNSAAETLPEVSEYREDRPILNGIDELNSSTPTIPSDHIRTHPKQTQKKKEHHEQEPLRVDASPAEQKSSLPKPQIHNKPTAMRKTPPPPSAAKKPLQKPPQENSAKQQIPLQVISIDPPVTEAIAFEETTRPETLKPQPPVFSMPPALNNLQGASSFKHELEVPQQNGKHDEPTSKPLPQASQPSVERPVPMVPPKPPAARLVPPRGLPQNRMKPQPPPIPQKKNIIQPAQVTSFEAPTEIQAEHVDAQLVRTEVQETIVNNDIQIEQPQLKSEQSSILANSSQQTPSVELTNAQMQEIQPAPPAFSEPEPILVEMPAPKPRIPPPPPGAGRRVPPPPARK